MALFLIAALIPCISHAADCKFKGQLKVYPSKQVLTPVDPKDLPGGKNRYKDINNLDICVYDITEAPNGRDTQLSKNFKIKDFQSFNRKTFTMDDGTKCPKGRYDGLRISPLIVDCVQRVRDAVRVPINLMGGYRAPLHNKCRQGKPKSKHLSGIAADIIKPKGKDSISAMDFLDVVICQCKPLFYANGYEIAIGFSLYSVHVDHRSTLTTWLYESGKKKFSNSKKLKEYILNKQCDNPEESIDSKENDKPRSEENGSIPTENGVFQKIADWFKSWGSKGSSSAYVMEGDYYDLYDESVKEDYFEWNEVILYGLCVMGVVVLVCFICGIVVVNGCDVQKMYFM